MNLYRVSERWGYTPPAFEPEFAGTLQQAKDVITTLLRDDASLSKNAFLVELVDFPTDKTALLDYLAGEPLRVLRAWTSTPRGGLQEVQEPDVRQGDEERIEHDDTPHLEDGRDNCNDAGTGEGQYHGRM
jgi:hypothetical protein